MDVSSNHLTYYLNQILKFLISDGNSRVFPFVTMGMEDILVSIAKDIEFLKNEAFDDDCKSLASQITAVLERNKQIYTLSYEFKDEDGKKVIVYKKTKVELIGLKPLRKPKIIQPISNTYDKGLSKNFVMSSFKTMSLNSTLKFVKNDSQHVLRYPDMTTEQMEFIKHMITQCMTPTEGSGPGTGFREMYDPLTEALKIFGLKYEFKLNNAEPSHYDMKCLSFEKIPKVNKTKEETDLTDNKKQLHVKSDGLNIMLRPVKSTSMAKVNTGTTRDVNQNMITKSTPIVGNEKTSELNTNTQIRSVFIKKVKVDYVKVNINVPVNLHSLQKVNTDSAKVKTVPVHSESIKKVNTVSAKVNKNVPMHTESIEKVNIDSAKVNKNTPMQTESIEKVNTDYAKVNKNVPVNSESIEKVDTGYAKVNKNVPMQTESKEKVNTDYAKMNKNVPVNSESIEKVDTGSAKMNKNVSMQTESIKNNNTGSAKLNENVPMNSVSIEKLNTDSAKANEIEPLKSLSIRKVNTDSVRGIKSVLVISDSDIEKSKSLKVVETLIPESGYTRFLRNKTVQRKLGHLASIIAELSPKFAQNSLTQLRNFLQENSTSYTFTNLSITDSEFLMQWRAVSQRIEIIQMFSIPGQMILDEIREAVSRLTKYTVIVTQEIISRDNRNVIFTKRPHSQNSKKLDPTQDFGCKDLIHEGAMNSEISSKWSKNYKKLQNFFNNTSKLDSIWLKTTLQRLKDFLEDESQASCVIPSVTQSQMEFLDKWPIQKYINHVKGCYNSDVQMLLNKLQRMVEINAKFTVSMDMGRVSRNQTRDAIFRKNPFFSTLPPKQETSTPKYNLPAKSAPKSNAYAYKTEIRVKTKEGVLMENEPKLNENKEIKTYTAKSYIPKSVSVTSLPSEKACATSDRGRPKSANVKSNKAKEMLIEALSQPLVSERGIRMMRSMGWEGGALGVRGEGIVEPIALQLDLSRRAGLGSKKKPSTTAVPPRTNVLDTQGTTKGKKPLSPSESQPSLPAVLPKTNLLDITEAVKPLSPDITKPIKPLCPGANLDITKTVIPLSPSKEDFKSRVLQTIVDMLVMKQPAMELDLATKLTKTDWKFVRSIANCLNARKKVTEDPSFAKLCQKILDIMTQSDLIITACCGVTKKNIRFILSKDIYQPSYLDSKNWCAVVNVDNKKQNQALTVDGQTLTVDISDTEDVKMVTGRRLRFYVLKQILKFCQEPIILDEDPSKSTITKDVLLKGQMTHKKMSSVKEIIKTLNLRCASSSDLEIERNLFDEVKKAMHGFDLEIKFITPEDRLNTIIRFNKTLYFKQITSKPNKPATDNVDRSMESINKIITENIKTETNMHKETNENVQDKKNYVASTKSTSASEITKSPRNIIIKINNKENNAKNKINTEDESNARRRITFSRDSFDSTCIFENQNAPTDDHEAPINSHNAPKDRHKTLINTQNAPKLTKLDDSNKVNTEDESNVRRRITFTRDSFDSTCMFENQNALTYDHEAPINSQNAPKDRHKAPINGQNAPTDGHKAPIIAQNTPNITKLDDLTCLPDYKKDLNNKDVICIETNNTTGEETVEYIFIDNESYENDISNPTVTKNDIENNIPMVTVNDKNGNDVPIVTEDDKQENAEREINYDIESNQSETVQTVDASNLMAAEKDSDLNLNNLNINNQSQALADNNKFMDQTGVNALMSKMEEVSLKETLQETGKLNIKNKNAELSKIFKNLGKRLRSTTSSERAPKKCKYEFIKKIKITHKDYPQTKITTEMAGEIQKSILTSIDYAEVLPLLKCHGIKDGALLYSCHTEESVHLIENIVLNHHLQFTVTREREDERHKMAIRITTFLNESVDTIFERLETFNMSLNTKDWMVIGKKRSGDRIVIHVDIDDSSYKLILKDNFTLYAGTDEAKFSILWT